jgi:hypothetical protein
MEIDRTVHTALRHSFHDNGAEPTPLRPRYGRSIALGPAYREGIALIFPVDIHATLFRRDRPVFPGVGGKFMEGEPDGLRGSRVQSQLGPMRDDTRTNEIGEGR